MSAPVDITDFWNPMAQLEAVLDHVEGDLLDGIEETNQEQKRLLLQRAAALTALAIKLGDELAKLARVR